jgi:putative two-component system response regulator
MKRDASVVEDGRRALEEVETAQRELQRAHSEAMRRLASATERFDHGPGHLERVGRYAQILGRSMQLPPVTVDELLHACPLHDIGKITISTHLLMKPSPLDSDEWELLKTHTTEGARLLAGSTSSVIQMAERIALAHHERWDGGGYPSGLAGTDIPLEARICSVVDFFDTMAIDRSQGKALPSDEVVRMIRLGSGTQFDPEVVDRFRSALTEIEDVRTEHSAESPKNPV